jgi:hypothetical protein
MGLFDMFRRWWSSGSAMSTTLGNHRTEWNQPARLFANTLREAFYDNTIYRPRQQGGLLELIMQEELGKKVDPRKLRVLGFFNPVPQIVDTYQNIYAGTYGKDIKVAETVDGNPVNPALVDSSIDPIGRIWKMSNLDTEKAKLLEWGPNLGTVGIRIVATDDPDPAKRRVAIRFDHPNRIADFDTDDHGNVTAVLLRYELEVRSKLGDPNPRKVQVEELLDKNRFSLKYNGVEQLEPDQQVNTLGVCPYVILKHRDRGQRFGEHAYAGSEIIIHAVNYLVARQDKSIDRHVFPKWFAAAAGNPPVNIDLGEDSVAYTKMDPDSPTPIFQPLVAALNQGDTRAFWLEVIELLRERNPEMTINNLKLIAGTSGETLAQVLKPVEARILAARASYDHAMQRAIQIALSWGIILSMWDLGSGMGSVEAANSAFYSGRENFEFAERPVLPQSVYDKLNAAKVDTAARTQGISDAMAIKDDLSHRERLRMAGFNEEQIDRIDAERRTEDVIPTVNPDELNTAPTK